jgi:glutaminyl-peptide cyclotransferase
MFRKWLAHAGFSLLLLLTMSSLQQAETRPPAPAGAQRLGYQVVKSYPHDPQAFTQGLLYENGFLYESTGLEGASSLRKVELTTGRILQIEPLSGNLFGEGLALWKDRLVQLTWTTRIGFVYDLHSFKLIRNFNYSTEGWGLTQDGIRLILSDGSATLHFLDPDTFQEKKRIEVKDQGKPIDKLNELEFVKGEILANIWGTDLIAQISPQSGEVTAWIDLKGLLGPQNLAGRVDVLNGIAYDSRGNRLFVTGKLWPRLFEIKLVPLRPK